MMDARSLTEQQGGDPNSWAEVKKRLTMLTQKKYYSLTRYGYARGYQAYQFVENIRRYQISLIGYLQEKEKAQRTARIPLTDVIDAAGARAAGAYPAVTPDQLAHPAQ
ncbi:Membrane-bound lytic murein transglycosylase F precursor [Leminorella grimontii]|nr:Slt family transglycosylase [Leminorella grimontii ATCC 33999 = DSM 5078]VFS56792.1 Membrane-bound lytic murein transglycosylase F precursor [Leminorella grimontii]